MQLLDECTSHREFAHMSFDCTVRILRSILGQADYRASKATREAAPRPDSEAYRRVFTVIGRMGAPVVIEALKAETSENMAGCLANTLNIEQRSQCVTVSSDNPSIKLLSFLTGVLPNLECFSADPIHLVINYELSFGRKKQRVKSTQGYDGSL